MPFKYTWASSVENMNSAVNAVQDSLGKIYAAKKCMIFPMKLFNAVFVVKFQQIKRNFVDLVF